MGRRSLGRVLVGLLSRGYIGCTIAVHGGLGFHGGW